VKFYLQKPQATTEKILRSMPTRSPELPTYKSNNIDELDKAAQLKVQQDQEYITQFDKAQLKAQQDQQYITQLGMGIAIGLGIVGALALIVLSVMCYRWQCHKNDQRQLAFQTKPEPCPSYSFKSSYT
jgi:hypothetical protein